jgi:predicted enzyme related to lactoylglutathione lyase
MDSVAYFEIQSSNPEAALRFYEAVFGWKFTREPGIPIEYYRIETSGIRGGLLKRPAQVPPPECGTNAFVCSIEVPDFDRTAEIILKQGGQVALPKFAVPGVCYQGYFLDTDNNTFGLFQPDAQAR